MKPIETHWNLWNLPWITSLRASQARSVSSTHRTHDSRDSCTARLWRWSNQPPHRACTPGTAGDHFWRITTHDRPVVNWWFNKPWLTMVNGFQPGFKWFRNYKEVGCRPKHQGYEPQLLNSYSHWDDPPRYSPSGRQETCVMKLGSNTPQCGCASRLGLRSNPNHLPNRSKESKPHKTWCADCKQCLAYFSWHPQNQWYISFMFGRRSMSYFWNLHIFPHENRRITPTSSHFIAQEARNVVLQRLWVVRCLPFPKSMSKYLRFSWVIGDP